MCGIVAVLRRPTTQAVPDHQELIEILAGTELELRDSSVDASALERITAELIDVDDRLRGSSGLRCMLRSESVTESLAAALVGIEKRIAEVEVRLDQESVLITTRQQERVNAALIGVKDAWWAIAHDRLAMGRAVSSLLDGRPVEAVANLDGWWSIQVALASLDRLEVRGRDSAGLHVMVAGHGLDLSSPEIADAIGGRAADSLFSSGAIRVLPSSLCFVYKAAAEIGELGDNVRALRQAIAADRLLAAAVESPHARTTVIGHTRWASVGIISQPNAHPLNSEEIGRPEAPYVAAALNGDVDNHVELRQSEALSIAPEVTTDAKVIPAMISRRLARGMGIDEAFISTVSRFEGSVAIAASSDAEPDQIQLALAGSGQSLYIGLADDAFVVASEPYALVEETNRYIRMDGESTRGQTVTLDRSGAGTLGGVRRNRYSGEDLPLSDAEVVSAEITTRDVDRKGFEHFLLKELTEAPDSFRKTLRGRIVAGEGSHLAVKIGEDCIPSALAEALSNGSIHRVIVIGQGTAAVAGQAVASAVRQCLPGFPVHAMPATELSGFGLSDDMSDTLIVAISQSGTTTDTNRTVDLARTRGAQIVAIVNRRNSDLVAKSHGVFHTSDGRDVEMSVASTKAFYAQVAAGWLVAAALAQLLSDRMRVDRDHLDRVLTALRDLPVAMEELLVRRDEIGRIAASVSPSRRFWAVVGSGPDRIAASEVRIKLSELCYRSISADATEDKKHIDLSCEPLILVCAAGLRGSNADDVAKEVAIYKAHKAEPVVIVTEAECPRFLAAGVEVVCVPETEPAVAFILSAMVGHLFGYEAALSIDAQARPLRASRGAIEKAVSGGPDDVLERLLPDLESSSQPFLRGLREGSYNGNLEASTAVRLTGLLRYATGALPLEDYESETGKIGTPEALLADLLDALSIAIDELTRPIDAIKHQAKTVTVGISRNEDALFGAPLVKATLAAGAAPDALGYRALRTLGALDEAVDEVMGFTRYRIDFSPPVPTATVVDQGGIATGIPSRTDSDPRLLGTKHRAAEEREVSVAVGGGDGRTVVLVPEVKGRQVVGMTLLHVRFHDRLPAERAKAVLSGYRTRYSALADAVTETEPVFDDSRLGQEPIVELLTAPVYELARRWRYPTK
jgi:glucosamine--fructose-6-phosphate aminotransferase (isomerizing)